MTSSLMIVSLMECNIKKNDDIFLTQEIEIEEMAIDGICGVY